MFKIGPWQDQSLLPAFTQKEEVSSNSAKEHEGGPQRWQWASSTWMPPPQVGHMPLKCPRCCSGGEQWFLGPLPLKRNGPFCALWWVVTTHLKSTAIDCVNLVSAFCLKSLTAHLALWFSLLGTLELLFLLRESVANVYTYISTCNVSSSLQGPIIINYQSTKIFLFLNLFGYCNLKKWVPTLKHLGSNYPEHFICLVVLLLDKQQISCNLFPQPLFCFWNSKGNCLCNI